MAMQSALRAYPKRVHNQGQNFRSLKGLLPIRIEGRSRRLNNWYQITPTPMAGLDPLVAEAATKSLADIVIKILGDGKSKLLGLFGRTVHEKTQQLILQASKQYVEKYVEHYGYLKVLGMQQPVALESVYTAIQFFDEQDIRSSESIETLENDYRQAKIRSFQLKDSAKREGIEVANQEQYLMVLGGLGAGKTTFLKKMGLSALKGESESFNHECIPVFIELKRFNSGDIDIEKIIFQELDTCGFPSAKELTAKALEKGKLLFLLDGLDEVHTENRKEVISQIQDFLIRHNKNRFIASCRLAVNRHSFQVFTNAAIADFDNLQIEQFITNWFSSEPDTAKDCWQKLNRSTQAAAKELTQTPLLLTLVCLLYQRYRKFPTHRAAVYERALRVLLEEWAAEKGMLQEDIYKALDTKRKELIISKIAHDAFHSDRLFLTRREVADQIGQLLREMLPDEKLIDATAVLKSIEVQHGVLVERAEDIYSFSHLTLQEYLTAQYITDHRQIEQLVAKHLTDRRWQEIFWIVAGLMRGGADELLLRMEKEIQKYINTPRLKTLLMWADWATSESPGNFKPVTKRANAIANANAIARAIAFANAKPIALGNTLSNAIAFAIGIANVNFIVIGDSIAVAMNLSKTIDIAIANARKLEKLKVFKYVNFNLLIARLEALKAKVPDDRQPLEERRAFAIHLLRTWLKALHIRPELVNLSEEEATALENYFYANLLLMRCKQSAVRVSPTTWEAIEGRMLLLTR